MGFLSLKSTNPNFSFIIYKNPDTGTITRPLRKGKCSGYYTKDSTQEYNLYFEDSGQSPSYKGEAEKKIEHLNSAQYNSPVMILNMLQDRFNTTRGKREEHDTEGYLHEFRIEMINAKLSTSIMNHMASYPSFLVEYSRRKDYMKKSDLS